MSLHVESPNFCLDSTINSSSPSRSVFLIHDLYRIYINTIIFFLFWLFVTRLAILSTRAVSQVASAFGRASEHYSGLLGIKGHYYSTYQSINKCNSNWALFV